MHKPTGLSEAVLQQVKDILTSSLQQKEFQVFIFGSRATGKDRKYSDLDLWIEAKPTLTENEKSHLLLAFEESDLPIKIDIITPESCLDAYCKRILRERKLWLTKTTPLN